MCTQFGPELVGGACLAKGRAGMWRQGLLGPSTGLGGPQHACAEPHVAYLMRAACQAGGRRDRLTAIHGSPHEGSHRGETPGPKRVGTLCGSCEACPRGCSLNCKGWLGRQEEKAELGSSTRQERARFIATRGSKDRSLTGVRARARSPAGLPAARRAQIYFATWLIPHTPT